MFESDYRSLDDFKTALRLVSRKQGGWSPNQVFTSIYSTISKNLLLFFIIKVNASFVFRISVHWDWFIHISNNSGIHDCIHKLNYERLEGEQNITSNQWIRHSSIKLLLTLRILPIQNTDTVNRSYCLCCWNWNIFDYFEASNGIYRCLWYKKSSLLIKFAYILKRMF